MGEKLVNLVIRVFGLSSEEATEAIAAVKQKNGGRLRELRKIKFFKLIKNHRRQKSIEKWQSAKEESRSWDRTCRFCFQIFCKKQARDRHVTKMHSDINVTSDDENQNTEAEITISNIVDDIIENTFKASNDQKNQIVKCPQSD